MAPRDFPLRTLTTVYHVGTLNRRDKGQHSHEGKGLSVSLHPEEWMQIARLSGPTYELYNPTGRFLDVHAMSEENRAHAHAWALERGYLTSRMIHVARWHDDEVGEDKYTYCSTLEDAEFFAEEEGQVTLELRDALTPLGMQRAGYAGAGADSDVTYADDGVALLYAEEEMGVDGVWFEDRLDPLALSAPRGVVFPQRLTAWVPSPLDTAPKASRLAKRSLAR